MRAGRWEGSKTDTVDDEGNPHVEGIYYRLSGYQLGVPEIARLLFLVQRRPGRRRSRRRSMPYNINTGKRKSLQHCGRRKAAERLSPRSGHRLSSHLFAPLRIPVVSFPLLVVRMRRFFSSSSAALVILKGGPVRRSRPIPRNLLVTTAVAAASGRTLARGVGRPPASSAGRTRDRASPLGLLLRRSPAVERMGCMSRPGVALASPGRYFLLLPSRRGGTPPGCP